MHMGSDSLLSEDEVVVKSVPDVVPAWCDVVDNDKDSAGKTPGKMNYASCNRAKSAVKITGEETDAKDADFADSSDISNVSVVR